MRGVEASGKTVEEAVGNALAELGVGREAVDVEVLSEGRGGVFGIGGGQARVRVRLATEDGVVTDEPAADAGRPEHTFSQAGPEDGLEDEAAYAARVLDRLLQLMGIEADITIRDPETPGDGLGMVKAVFDVEGDDLGILIGRRGSTLAALQYLLNVMVSRELREHISFTIDIEGYRRRRERQLNSLARRMAEQVKRTQRPITLEPMPANERRLVHLALSEDRYVSTESTGEGDERKVAISLRRG